MQWSMTVVLNAATKYLCGISQSLERPTEHHFASVSLGRLYRIQPGPR